MERITKHRAVITNPALFFPRQGHLHKVMGKLVKHGELEATPGADGRKVDPPEKYAVMSNSATAEVYLGRRHIKFRRQNFDDLFQLLKGCGLSHHVLQMGLPVPGFAPGSLSDTVRPWTPSAYWLKQTAPLHRLNGSLGGTGLLPYLYSRAGFAVPLRMSSFGLAGPKHLKFP